MKFAFLVQKPKLGGLASMHDRLKEALEDQGHEVDKLVVQHEEVISKVKKRDYDIVHLYFSPFLNTKFFLRLLKLNIFSDKKIYVNYYNIKPENLFRRVLKRSFLPLVCTKIVLPSKNMETFYRNVIGIKNTATLRPIVEEKFYNIDSRGDKIIYFGHSRPDKGVDRLMDIASEEMPVHCYFIQDKEHVLEQHPDMEEKLEKGAIVWHDELPEKALSEAKISIFPFHNLENTVDLPLSLIESLAAGVPVLTTNLSPMNEHLPEEFLVENWDRGKIVEGIDEISEKGYRNKAKETAKNMEVDRESVVNHYIDIIHDQDPQ